MKTIISFLYLTVLACSMTYSKDNTPVPTFVEAADPTALSAAAKSDWDNSAKGLKAAWGSTNYTYSRSEIPQDTCTERPLLTAWRGERISAQLLLWSPDSINSIQCKVKDFRSDNSHLSSQIANTRFIRYTLTNRGSSEFLTSDMLDTLTHFNMSARTVRPVWITINIPHDAKPGIYTSEVNITHSGKGSLSLPFQLKVQTHTLPSPEKWQYHLDLWQHPAAIARVRGVEIWSDEHFEALKESMTTLAKAGQKVITTTLNKDPWNHQCYDAYEDMIRWTKNEDGSWSYDYKIFDRWVELMISLGINKMINCYSMVPWNEELHYMDRTQGQMVTVKAKPGSAEFANLWKPFLANFKQHLTTKGWLGITNIAMDERSPQELDAAVRILEECAPELGFAIADNHKSYKKYSMMRDVCVIQNQKADHEDIAMRREQGYNTTFYVCCGPDFPNTFVCSNPYEAELLGWYAVAADYDGMLRWAYNSWPENPLYDSRYGQWNGGDTFLIYPYNRSSIRFERLIDGIEVYEKIHILKKSGIDMHELDTMLNEMMKKDVNNSNLHWDEFINKANRVLNSI